MSTERFIAGAGCCGLLAFAFIAMKLLHVVSWSWVWVLLPIWLPAAIAVGVVLVMLAVAFLMSMLFGD